MALCHKIAELRPGSLRGAERGANVREGPAPDGAVVVIPAYGSSSRSCAAVRLRGMAYSWGMAGCAGSGWVGSVLASWLREPMPSLANTFPRW